MSDKMREEFETWAIAYATKHKYEYMTILLAKCPTDDNVYRVSWVDCAWIGWKASRESLVIELPDRYDWTAEQVGIFKDDEGTLFDADAVVEAIEAAGLKVKP
jgi:hypothetical protein